MKTIMTVFLLLVSTSLLAAPEWANNPECSNTPGACAGGVPSGKVAAIPEPGTLALIGLGAAGLVFVRRRKR